MAPLKAGVVAVLLCGAGLLAFHEFSPDGITYAANGGGRDASSARLHLASEPRSTAPRVGSDARSPRAAIAFDLERAGAVDLEIFDLEGRSIATVARREYLEAGPHRIAWRQDPDRPVEPGLYFVRLRTDTGIWRQTLIRVPGTRDRSGRS
jgi:hypothetical protein